MAQQTAVEWLVQAIGYKDESGKIIISIHPDCNVSDLIQQAKQMEKEQMIEMYNAGYTDSQCNHINDAENYVNELLYVKGRE